MRTTMALDDELVAEGLKEKSSLIREALEGADRTRKRAPPAAR